MQMPSISIVAVGSAVIAPLAVFLRYLLKQPPKVASTSEELLDLFEDRCALLEEPVVSISPNNDAASEHFTASAAGNLTPVSASPAAWSTHEETWSVDRRELARPLISRCRGRREANSRRLVVAPFAMGSPCTGSFWPELTSLTHTNRNWAHTRTLG
jgi:hypothetical protein